MTGVLVWSVGTARGREFCGQVLPHSLVVSKLFSEPWGGAVGKACLILRKYYQVNQEKPKKKEKEMRCHSSRCLLGSHSKPTLGFLGLFFCFCFFLSRYFSFSQFFILTHDFFWFFDFSFSFWRLPFKALHASRLLVSLSFSHMCNYFNETLSVAFSFHMTVRSVLLLFVYILLIILIIS